MYLLNKIVGGCLNPLVIGLAGMVAAGVCVWFGRRRIAVWLGVVAICWLWLWSTPMMYRWIGASLESEWPVVEAKDTPMADAIVLLGGGMGSNTNVYPYAEMWNGADRVWHAARLYKAGKAPLVIPTGCGERESSLPLLLDLGVPEKAIRIEDEARNTEENAKFVERMLESRDTQVARKRVLLVTSAWHMRRSVLMYRKYAPNLEIIPAATDYEATVNTEHPFCFKDLWPDASYLFCNSYVFKEYLGYWGYKLMR